MNDGTHKCVDCGSDISHMARQARVCLSCKKARKRHAKPKTGPRLCEICSADIAHRKNNAKFCEGCFAKSRRAGAGDCIDCGININHKRSDAERCDACAAVWKALRGAEWKREIRKDPEFLAQERERYREYWREYSNRPGFRAMKTEYWNRLYRENLDYKTRHDAAKHRRRGAISGSYTRDELIAKYSEFGNACAYCGDTGPLTVDHVIPISKGGANTIDNIVPACRSCNASKGNRDIEEWLPTRTKRVVA